MQAPDFKTGDRVRLLNATDQLDMGSEGTLIGAYRRETTTYLVRFGEIELELPADALVSVNPD